ncbi:MAG: hypothetical protein Q8R00_00525 [Candidatus Nanoarchaeia archaeon]|nr:hypothetical protein [Candidatus Nanoarchaeia archaeon]
MTEYKLGVDIGGVIIDRINDSKDTSFFSDNYLNTTAVPGAFEYLSKLNKGIFKDKLFIVSKCGENNQRKSLEWMTHTGFYEITGIPKERLHFCRERSGKGPICAKIGITHFIDDRLEVLKYMIDYVDNLYLFKPQESEIKGWEGFLNYVKRVNNWKEIADMLKNI